MLEVTMMDLIVDNYGNYYEVTKWSDNEVTLVNAFMRYSFNMIMFFTKDIDSEFKKKYDGRYTGAVAYDTLIQRIDMVKKNPDKIKGRLLTFNDLIKDGYTINVQPLFTRSETNK